MGSRIINKKNPVTVSANILVRNELVNISKLIKNLLDACVDELVFLDGGSTDGSWELLEKWSIKEPRITLLRWPQKEGSEFKKSFNEVSRRNLMLDASTSDFILYIDADERVSLNLKDLIDPGVHCIAASRTSFWNGYVRENGPSDRLWRPDISFRIFKRSPNLRFRTNDKNGLHNFLCWKGVKIPLGVNKGKIYVFLSNIVRTLLGVKANILEAPPRIFHYHYFDLSKKKVNDLRSAEFNWSISIDAPPSLRKKESKVYVTTIGNDIEAIEMTSNYWI